MDEVTPEQGGGELTPLHPNHVKLMRVNTAIAVAPFVVGALVLHTAGTHNASILLPGLGEEQAVAMRETIREKIAAATP